MYFKLNRDHSQSRAMSARSWAWSDGVETGRDLGGFCAVIPANSADTPRAHPLVEADDGPQAAAHRAAAAEAAAQEPLHVHRKVLLQARVHPAHRRLELLRRHLGPAGNEEGRFTVGELINDYTHSSSVTPCVTSRSAVQLCWDAISKALHRGWIWITKLIDWKVKI